MSLDNYVTSKYIDKSYKLSTAKFVENMFASATLNQYSEDFSSAFSFIW